MPRDHIGLGEKIGYSLGDMASNFFFQTFNIFLLYYYTDIVGLSAAWVGTLMVGARVWDAISDPVMGAVSDRTKSRWGRYRPWVLWTAVPYGIIGYLLFRNPDLSPDGKQLYAAVTYLAMMTVYTIINIPYSSLMGVMSPSSDERATLSTFRFIGAFGGGLIISVAALPLKNYLGHVTPEIKEAGGAALAAAESVGFRSMMGIFALIAIVCFLITFATTKERITPKKEKSSSLGNDIKILFQNKPWLIMWIAAIFTLTNTAVRNGAIIYYFKYYVGNEDATTIFYLTGGSAMLAGVASTKFFMKRWDKKTLLIVLSLINAVGMLSFFFIPSDQLVLMNVVNIIATFFCGPTPALVWAMYTDVADYADWKFKRRATGLTFSSAMFAQKMGLALGGGMVGWILGALGFVANQAQGPEATMGIRLIFSVIPAGFMIANALVMLLYPLTDDKVRAIEADLKARDAATA